MAIVVTAGRLYIRWAQLGKFETADHLNIVALASLICMVAIENVVFPLDLQIYNGTRGLGPRPSEATIIKDMKLQMVEGALFGISLSCVKLSLLFFYKSIFGINKTFVRLCHALMALVVIILLMGVTSSFWSCGSPSQFLVLGTNAYHDIQTQRLTFQILA